MNETPSILRALVMFLPMLLAAPAFGADYAGPPVLAPEHPARAEKPGTGVLIFRPPKEEQKAQPLSDELAVQQVDAALIRWSSAWMVDRYIRGTSRVLERALTDDAYFVRGSFVFDRMGRRYTIPFGAVFAPQETGYGFVRLCYQDQSSGMQDCVDPGNGIAQRLVQANQARQLLAGIAIAGVVAAITSNTGGPSSGSSNSTTETRRKPICATEYAYSEPGMMGYEDNGPGARGLRTERCAR